MLLYDETFLHFSRKYLSNTGLLYIKSHGVWDFHGFFDGNGYVIATFVSTTIRCF